MLATNSRGSPLKMTHIANYSHILTILKGMFGFKLLNYRRMSDFNEMTSDRGISKDTFDKREPLKEKTQDFINL